MSTQWLEQTSKDITNQQGAYTNKETPLYSRRTRKAISFDDEEEVDDTQLSAEDDGYNDPSQILSPDENTKKNEDEASGSESDTQLPLDMLVTA